MTYNADIRMFLTAELGRDLSGVGDDASLLERGMLDSIGVMRLAAFIEERYGIAIVEDDLMPEYFDTIDAIAGLIKSRAEGLGT